MAGCGRGTYEAGECRVFAVCDLALYGCRRVYGEVDVSDSAEGNELRLRRSDGEEAPDRVGDSGRCVVGGGEYSDSVCDPRCRSGNCVSNVEHQRARWNSLG